MRRITALVLGAAVSFVLGGSLSLADYVNFESSHVHPIALTPSGGRLLAVNTPDAILEVFTSNAAGALTYERSIMVGLEPVTVRARTDSEAWVVNNLSDTISIVDLNLGYTVKTLSVGDEPTDVVFANSRAFVTVSQEDAVKVYLLSNLDAAPVKLDLMGRKPRSLAVSSAGDKVYAVPLFSGNQTTVVHNNVAFGNDSGMNTTRLAQLGLNDIRCNGSPPPYPPLPAGIARNPALNDPPAPVKPKVGLIVRWDIPTNQWKDEVGTNWNNCLPFRLPDHDLFVISTTSPYPVTTVDHLGTNLFEVSVHPNGKIYVPNTDARNFVRFEHPLGVKGHVVDNLLSIVTPPGNSVTKVNLNSHINYNSDPATNLAERQASVSQPGSLVWNALGTFGYMTAIGSRKLFRVDGACTTPSCILGPSRATPTAVVVGEGPTGVALKESANRLYVLNRFSNSIALVNAATMTKLSDVPLHDPGSLTLKTGRRLLYDGIDTSGHGDSACSSCHISGDRDGLTWDLGNPAGDLTPYNTPGDNVRFVQAAFGSLFPCTPELCSVHAGFDPEKGPMGTQTLRAMIEPLHWRGDRATMNEFNPAFVGLLGAKDIGPINGKPAGLSSADMSLFRSFALDMRFPPNPHRNVDDTLPNVTKTIPGHQLPGNPTVGRTLFTSGNTDLNGPCITCHQDPFGNAGGKLGGINPGDPDSDKAALFNGDQVRSPHSDLKVPQLRNLYEKFGPRFGSHTNPGDPPADQKSGFGFIHDGSIPDLGTFLSASIFTVTSQQTRDLTMFVLHFPTGTRPATGQNVTVPAGAPPTGTAAQETLLATLINFGNLADPNRHCELVVSIGQAPLARTYYLSGGIGSGGLWTNDVDTPLSTIALRSTAAGPLSFLCATVGSGVRLGADRDIDNHANGSDCAPADATTFAAPTEVNGLSIDNPAVTTLAWTSQALTAGSSVVYDVAGGGLVALHTGTLAGATTCLSGDLSPAQWVDTRPAPTAGDGYYYLVRAQNSCGLGTFGPGRASLNALACP